VKSIAQNPSTFKQTVDVIMSYFPWVFLPGPLLGSVDTLKFKNKQHFLKFGDLSSNSILAKLGGFLP
jgi:hypothetical protein